MPYGYTSVSDESDLVLKKLREIGESVKTTLTPQQRQVIDDKYDSLLFYTGKLDDSLRICNIMDVIEYYNLANQRCTDIMVGALETARVNRNPDMDEIDRVISGYRIGTECAELRQLFNSMIPRSLSERCGCRLMK